MVNCTCSVALEAIISWYDHESNVYGERQRETDRERDIGRKQITCPKGGVAMAVLGVQLPTPLFVLLYYYHVRCIYCKNKGKLHLPWDTEFSTASVLLFLFVLFFVFVFFVFMWIVVYISMDYICTYISYIKTYTVICDKRSIYWHAFKWMPWIHKPTHPLLKGL